MLTSAHRPVFRSLVTLVMSGLVHAHAAPAQGRSFAPLNIADAMATRTLPSNTPIVVSPDGEWVAYTITDPRSLRRHTSATLAYLPSGTPTLLEASQLWIANTRTGETRNLTGPHGTSWGGVWSPDGKRLAFYSDRDGQEHVWIWNRTTGRTTRVSALIAHPFFGVELMQWLPNGSGLLVKLLPEGARLQTLPDSASLTEVQVPDDTMLTAHAYTANMSRRDTTRGMAVPSLQYELADLAILSVKTGTARRLVRQPIMGYAISPTGRSIAFATIVGADESVERTGRYDVGVVDVASGASRTIAHGVLDYWRPTLAWSSDGRRLAFTSMPHSWYLVTKPARPIPAGDCFIWDVGADSARSVTPGAHADFGSDFAAPTWDRTGRTLYLVGSDTLWRIDLATLRRHPLATASGRLAIAIVAREAGTTPWQPAGDSVLFVRTFDTTTLKVGIERVNVATGETVLLYEDDEAFPSPSRASLNIAAGGATVVYAREKADEPIDLWTADPSFRQPRRLTHINPQLDAYMFGKSRLVHWLNDDGKRLQGSLLLPPDYAAGTRYPVIVYAYGGEHWSMFLNSFGAAPMSLAYMQTLATRGFAVFVPDAPQHKGTPMLDLAKDILPGVTKLVDLGIADSERLGIMGQSYGCLSTLMVLVQTPRFRAAQCSSGTSSLIREAALFGGSGVGWALDQGQMRDTLWNNRDEYIENSPYFYLDRVTTPILMFNGTADTGVPISDQDATFEALRTLGKHVVYVRYGGEGHVPMSYSAANRADFLQRTIDWFERYLGSPPRQKP